jgi:hypothetical protein
MQGNFSNLPCRKISFNNLFDLYIVYYLPAN